MATVIFSSEQQRLTGVPSVQVAAADVRSLIAELDRRFPGLSADALMELAVAVDGEIIHEPMFESVGPDSEVHFLMRISGG